MSLETNFVCVSPEHIQEINLRTNKFNQINCSDLIACKLTKFVNSNVIIRDIIISGSEAIKFHVTSSEIVLKKGQENPRIIANSQLAKEWMEAVKGTIRVINPVLESFSFVVDNRRKKNTAKETDHESFFSETKKVLKKVSEEMNDQAGKCGSLAELNQIGHLGRHGGHLLSKSFHHIEFPHFFGE